MLKISVAVILLITGVISTDTCDESLQQICPIENAPEEIPETEEDLKNICKFGIGIMECVVEYEENCNPDGTIKERADGFLNFFLEICDEDTLLYAAIVDNLKCFTAMEKEGQMDECEIDLISSEKYVESLRENGLLTLTEDETELYSERVCISDMVEIACLGTKIENKCGIIAMDTFIEIVEKFIKPTQCGSKIHLLPEIVQIYKLGEQEAKEISDILKKRK